MPNNKKNKIKKTLNNDNLDSNDLTGQWNLGVDAAATAHGWFC